jgi:hypothetical protein
MKIYTIRDQVAGYFMPPFFAENDGHATRMFIQSMGDSFVHRADFSLHSIGTFDADTGVLSACDASMVISGLSIDPKLDPRVPNSEKI